MHLKRPTRKKLNTSDSKYGLLLQVMWLIILYTLVPLTEASSGSKYIKLLWKMSYKRPSNISSVWSLERLLNFLNINSPFTVHTGSCDIHLVNAIIKNKNPIELLSRRLCLVNNN